MQHASPALTSLLAALMLPLPSNLPWHPSSTPRPGIPKATSFPDSSYKQYFPPAVASLVWVGGPGRPCPAYKARAGSGLPWLPPQKLKMPRPPWASVLTFNGHLSPDSGQGLGDTCRAWLLGGSGCVAGGAAP